MLKETIIRTKHEEQNRFYCTKYHCCINYAVSELLKYNTRVKGPAKPQSVNVHLSHYLDYVVDYNLKQLILCDMTV